MPGADPYDSTRRFRRGSEGRVPFGPRASFSPNSRPAPVSRYTTRVGSFLVRHQSKILALVTVASAAALIWLDDHRHELPKGPAPSLDLHLLGSKEAVTLETLHGQPVVLDFWATWCKPCRASLPHLNELAKKYNGRARIIAVNAESEAESKQIETRDQLKLEIPVAYDGVIAAGQFNVEVLPTTVVLDKEGKIVETFQGSANPDAIGRVLDKLL